MTGFSPGKFSRALAMEELQIGKTRLYELRSSFLAAKAAEKASK